MSSWTLATWTTPALPASATALSFGLTLHSTGSLTVDDYSLRDDGLAPPEVALLSPVSGSSVRGTVTLTASASAAGGLDHVEFLVGGAPFAALSAPPFTVAWDSRSVADGAASLAVRAYDVSGNATPSPSNEVTVTNLAGLVQNPSLESDVAARDGVPDCWQRVGFGTNTAVWTTTSDAHSGSRAQRVDINAFASGGQRLVPTLDSGQCAPPGTPGRTYQVSGWYKSSAQPRWVFFYRDQTGAWIWWAQSPLLPPASTWTQATWTTPALPANATALSFGLSLYSTGSLTMDHFTLFER